MEERDYNFTKKQFKELEKLADHIYNLTIITDFYCSNQMEIEELYNLNSVIKVLRNYADTLNSIFINYDNDAEY